MLALLALLGKSEIGILLSNSLPLLPLLSLSPQDKSHLPVKQIFKAITLQPLPTQSH